MVPTVYDNVVYISTVPGSSENFYQGGQRGILYALDARTGHELWDFDTTADNLWGAARLNSGGGLWYPPSVDERGNLYFGVGNAAPWPGVVVDGTPYPNGSSRPGNNDYASSMVSLDPRLGSVRWYHNAKPHDLFDLDFQLTPIIATVSVDGVDTKIAIGSGKVGRVVAANADTGELLWDAKVGKHQNDDLQAVPPGQSVEVYPGPLGGVETPMAFADGTVFVPVVNLPIDFTSTGLDLSAFDYGKATGELIAINAADGTIEWDVQLPTMVLGGAAVANDVVFTAGLDGVVRGFNVADGSEVFTYQAAAGINAPLAIAGDTLLVPAGGFLIPAAEQGQVEATPGSAAGVQPATPGAQAAPRNELIALSIGATGVPAATQAPAQPTQPPAPTATTAGQQTNAMTITMVDIAFNPNALTIPANTDVTIQLANQGAAIHNFNIDELNVHSGDVPAGQTGSVTINAQPGTYGFYCSVPGHKEAGMVGTLTVQ
jgi:outer membrane protein assembly factor BamB/plastocyanin